MLMKKLPIEAIFDDFFNNCEESLEIITEILKLQLAMVDNKSHKLSGIKAARVNYALHEKMMKYWIFILDRAVNDNWEDVLFQIYSILVSMIKGHHLNFYLLMRISEHYQTFMVSFIKNLSVASSWIRMYP